MLDRLLQHHAAIVKEPQGLPQARLYDHCIHLLPGSPSGRTATPSYRRTSWSARSGACSRRASSA
jgi:hypothetical protein